MADHAGWAHVAAVRGGPLYHLHDADLGRAEVAVVHRDAAPGPGLPVAADVTHGWGHAAGEREVVQNYKSYNY